MANYRAIVSIMFDSEDLQDFADSLGINGVNPDEALDGMLDNLEFGSGWTEQIFQDGTPTIVRLTNGIMVEISPHEE